jgi:hypothetical protein
MVHAITRAILPVNRWPHGYAFEGRFRRASKVSVALVVPGPPPSRG